MANKKEFLTRMQRNRVKRHAGIVGRVGDLIFDENKMLEQILDRKVPTMMQHCVIKVMPKLEGTDRVAFIGAYNICSSVFMKYGYVRKNSVNFKMTAKGVANNRRHQREKEASRKKARWDSLVKRLWQNAMNEIKQQRKERKRKPRRA